MEIKDIEEQIEAIENKEELDILMTTLFKKMRATQKWTGGGWSWPQSINNNS